MNDVAKIIIVTNLTILTLFVLLFAFSGLGLYTINIEKSFVNEYTSCLNDKQVVSDQLQYCKDIKGIKDNPFSSLFYFVIVMFYVIGLGFMFFNLYRKSLLDAREKELDNRVKVKK